MTAFTGQLTAQQHLFTRLEGEYSAQRRSGYQTACASTGLSPAEITELEKRVQCYQPSEAGMVRHQFFALSSGRLALSHTCEVPTNREINDASGRAGIFLAHTVVLGKDDLAQVWFDPFCVFDAFDFARSTEELVARFGKAVAKIEVASLTPTEPPSTQTAEWRAPEMRKLVSLAMHAQDIASRKQSVSFIGTPDATQRALRELFAFAPVSDRVRCTFDTCVDRCVVVPGSLWAVGMSSRQNTTAYLEVSSKDKVVLANLAALAAPTNKTDVYVGWLDYKVKQAGNNPLLPTTAHTAHLVAQGILSGAPPAVAALDEATARELYELHQKHLDERLQTALTQATNTEAAEAALPFLRQALTRAELTSATAAGFEPRRLAQHLLGWLMQAQRPALSDKAYKGLADLAQQANNPVLLFLAATLGGKPEEDLRDAALQAMTGDEFALLLPFLLNPIEPEHFVWPKHLGALLAEAKLADTSAPAALALIRRMMSLSLQKELDALTPLLEKLDSGQLVSVEKGMQKLASPAAEKFERAVQRRRDALGKPSLLDNLRNR